MVKKFLDEALELQGDARTVYSQWAATYDAEVAENGYVTPERCALALRNAGASTIDPVLDLGCGTGLGGLALKLAGFQILDGVDLTPEMIERARARDIYRDLTVGDASIALQDRSYNAIVAVGILSPGHAPASLIDTVMHALPSDGRFVFSLSDKALAERSYAGRVMAWTDSGSARCLIREHGEHLPGKKVGATIYALQKR